MDRPTDSDQILAPEIAAAGDGAGTSPDRDVLASPVVGEAASLTDAERREALDSAVWHGAGVLYRRRWWILGLCFAIAVGTAAITLRMPNRYASSARLLIPDSAGGGLGAIIGDLSPIASSVLGGGGGDYTRYLAILTSRSTMEGAVERFDLTRVYDLEGEPFAASRTLGELEDNVEFEVDLELEFLNIRVMDEDPNRAAAIANYFTETLNERNAELATEGAQMFREYVETRYEETQAALDDAREALRAFQERNGVVELETMAQAYVEALAQQRGELARLEIEYQALRSQFGDENPDVQAAAAAVATARRGETELLGGRDRAVPLSYRNLPALGSQYAALYQEVLIQAQVLEASLPLLEQARFDEARERVAVQVIDEAVPAARKAEPKRTVIVLVTAFSAFLLLCAFFLVLDWFNRNGGYVLARLRRV